MSEEVKKNTEPNITKRKALIGDQWDQVAADLSALAKTGKRTALLNIAAREDPARYAALNSNAMKPIREEHAAKVEAEKKAAAKRAREVAGHAAARAAAAEERIAQRTAQILSQASQ